MINWHVLQLAQVYLQCIIWFNISEKYMCVSLPLCRFAPKVSTRHTKPHNILERKLCNSFGQLLHIYLKNVEHRTGHDADQCLWSLHTLGNPERCGRFNEYLAI